MTHRLKAPQRGMSFIGLLLVLGLLAALGVLVAQVVPTALEYQAVRRAVDKASAGGNPADVRALFDRAAQVDNVTSISGKDLEVTRGDGGLVVRFAYEREIHLLGPAYLLLKYSGSSS